ncbi:TetR/AcrR family transcriptional regulator [Nocardia sp. NPDC056064]|uniref:TetR/AcrR family transcriptional regulator n=1 Tax=Nocardia sp. NPDC056064 TaxID=3345701 RepID=UPI0035E158B6
MVSKREQVLDAAIVVLGTRGSRALTHRAVDEAAGLPTGSASNYFRTRAALLSGLAERLEQHDHADWAALDQVLTLSTLDDLVEGLARFAVHATTEGRVRTQARLALFGEAQTMPALHESVRRGHRRLRAMAIELTALAGVGAAEAGILVDYLDGVIMHRLTGADSDPRPALARLVRALTA